MANSSYSTRNISQKLLEEIKQALFGLDYGSLEIYVVNHEVTQITKRHIKKTQNSNVSRGAGSRFAVNLKTKRSKSL